MLLTLCIIVLAIVIFRFIFEIVPLDIKNILLYHLCEILSFCTKIIGILLTQKPIYCFCLEFYDDYNINKPKDPDALEAIATTLVATIAYESADMDEFKKIVQHIIEENNKLSKKKFLTYKASMLYMVVKYTL